MLHASRKLVAEERNQLAVEAVHIVTGLSDMHLVKAGDERKQMLHGDSLQGAYSWSLVPQAPHRLRGKHVARNHRDYPGQLSSKHVQFL